MNSNWIFADFDGVSGNDVVANYRNDLQYQICQLSCKMPIASLKNLCRGMMRMRAQSILPLQKRTVYPVDCIRSYFTQCNAVYISYESTLCAKEKIRLP